MNSPEKSWVKKVVIPLCSMLVMSAVSSSGNLSAREMWRAQQRDTKTMKGLLWREFQRDGPVQSGLEEGHGNLSVYKYLMGLVLFSSVQWQGKRWWTQEFHLNKRKFYFIQWGWSNSGTGFPERVWSVSILGNIQRPTGCSCDQPASRWLWFVHGGWTGFSPREAVSCSGVPIIPLLYIWQSLLMQNVF